MTDAATVQLVIRYLGRAACALIAGIIGLTTLLILRRFEPSTAVTSLLSGLSTLAGTVMGALGTLLVSTRSGPDNPAPVVLAPSTSNLEQVPTTPPAPPEAVFDPAATDAGAISVHTAATFGIFVITALFVAHTFGWVHPPGC